MWRREHKYGVYAEDFSFCSYSTNDLNKALRFVTNGEVVAENHCIRRWVTIRLIWNRANLGFKIERGMISLWYVAIQWSQDIMLSANPNKVLARGRQIVNKS